MSTIINTRAGKRNDYVRVALDTIEAGLPTYGIAAAASPGGTGEVTITHGRATTPTMAHVTLVGDVAAVFVDVVSLSATDLVIRFKNGSGADVTTGTYTVHWMVI